ncbi:OxaA precursor [Bacillus methanolicus]|uniref:membrane protein insertase YidC n=1 Tax=Bacillus methanolicus TaxID=1471 RepID=UPI002010B041|nr:membrane protein insertase YidC [Bacillus methanolicus]UQD52081.1 OxaA precursor [Bacillus methanolicus]
MKNNRLLLTLFTLFISTSFLTACQAAGGNNKSFFNTYIVQYFIKTIHFVAGLFGGNFGLSIIVITILIRLILMPLVLKQYKNQQAMKEKMDLLKPELDEIQKKLKSTKKPEEQQKLQQEMFALYRKHGVNPLSVGCLPIIIQMPILLGFYYAIRGSKEIATHSFLWFNLGQPDLFMTAAAGIVYYLQFKVSQSNLPEAQQNQMKYFGLLSPIMIVFVSLHAPAVLPLYWTVGGLFLIMQTILARKLYSTEKRRENSN